MDGYDSLIDFMKNDGKGMEKITFTAFMMKSMRM